MGLGVRREARSDRPSGCYTFAVHAITNTTTDSGEIQVFSHWAPTKQIIQLHAICSYVAAEISTGTTFNTTLKGASAYTFIATGHNLGNGCLGSAGLHRMAMLWE